MILPTAFSYKYKDQFSKQELKSLVNIILKSRRMKLKDAQVVKITVPYLGTFKSHGRKKRKGYLKVKSRDRKRKRELQRLKELTKESLLF